MELPQVVAASRLADRPAAAIVLSGIEALDALTGGLPRGGLTEICGPASSGRTSVLLAVMAKMTAQGEVCALVDASDSFDPQSAEAAGVELRRVLWIRCSPRRHGENRVIGRSGDRVIENGRSGQWSVASGQSKSQITNGKSPMDSLEQALKATDLLLQGGGFGLVVVDLGDVPAQAARRAADVVVPVSPRGGEHADGTDGGGAGAVRQDVRVGGVQAFSYQLSAISQAAGCRLQASGKPGAGARADFVGAGNFRGDVAVGGTREEAGAVGGCAVGKQDGMGGIRNL
ncbi:MAG: hypothetical protein ACHP7I_01575 [Terriglobales bacterium]